MKNTIKLNSGLLTAPNVLAASVAMAVTTQVSAENWSVNPEIFYTGSSDRWYGGGQVLFPLSQSSSSLTYADLRFIGSRFETREFNVGIGHRVLGDSSIKGGYLSYDRRSTTNDNDFNQVTLGLEYLTGSWDFNANYYHVLTDVEEELRGTGQTTTVTANAPVQTVDISSDAVGLFVGDELEVTTTNTSVTTTTASSTTRTIGTSQTVAFEEALSGFDIEVGYLLPINQDYETRLYLARYDFGSADPENEAVNTGLIGKRNLIDPGEDVTGTRVRLEFRPRKNLELGIAYQDDDNNGVQTFGSIKYSFGFENSIGQRSLSERMVELHERDIDVITVSNINTDDRVLDEFGNIIDITSRTRSAETEFADPVVVTEIDGPTTVSLDADGDGDADTFAHIDNSYEGGNSDGSFARPYVSFEDCYAGGCVGADVVYVHEGNSTTAGSEYQWGQEIVLEDSQTLLGEGVDFFGLGGDAFPVITNIYNDRDIIVLGENNEVSGIEIDILGTGGDTVVNGIFGEDVTFANIHNNRIISRDNGDLGTNGVMLTYNVAARNAGLRTGASAIVANNVISGMQDDSSSSMDGMGIAILSNFTNDGVFVQNLSLAGNRIQRNEGHGIAIENYALTGSLDLTQNLNFTGSYVSNNDGSGIYIANALYTGAQSTLIDVDQSLDLSGLTARYNESGVSNRTYVYVPNGPADGGSFTVSQSIIGDSMTRLTRNESLGLLSSAELAVDKMRDVTMSHDLSLTMDGSDVSFNKYGGIGLSSFVSAYRSKNAELSSRQTVDLRNSNISNNNYDGDKYPGGIGVFSGVYGKASSNGNFSNTVNVNLLNNAVNDNSGGLTAIAISGSKYSDNVTINNTLNTSVYGGTFNRNSSGGLTSASFAMLGYGDNSTVNQMGNLTLTNTEVVNNSGREINAFNAIGGKYSSVGNNTFYQNATVSLNNVHAGSANGGSTLNVYTLLSMEDQRFATIDQSIDLSITDSVFDISDRHGVNVFSASYLNDNVQTSANLDSTLAIDNSLFENMESVGVYFEDSVSMGGSVSSSINIDQDIMVTNSSMNNARWSDGMRISSDIDIGNSPFGSSFVSDVMREVDVTLYNVNFDDNYSAGFYFSTDFNAYYSDNTNLASAVNLTATNVSAQNNVWGAGIRTNDSQDFLGSDFSTAEITNNVTLNTMNLSRSYYAGYIESDFRIHSYGGSADNGDFTIDVNRNVSVITSTGNFSTGLAFWNDVDIGSYADNNTVAVTEANNFNDLTIQGSESRALYIWSGLDIRDDSDNNTVTRDFSANITNAALFSRDYSGLYVSMTTDVRYWSFENTVTETFDVYINNVDVANSSGGISVFRDLESQDYVDSLTFMSTESLTIVNSNVSNSQSGGIDIYMGVDSDYHGIDSAMTLDRTIMLDNNTISDVDSNGIEVDVRFRGSNSYGVDNLEFIQTTDLTMTNNTVSGGGSDGFNIDIGVWNGYYNNSGNDFTNNATVLISNNTISGQESDGVEFDWWLDTGYYDSNGNTGSGTIDLVIANNIIDDGGSDGLNIGTWGSDATITSNVTIDQNSITNLESDGVDFYAGVYGESSSSSTALYLTLSLTNNTISSVGSQGLEIDSNVGRYGTNTSNISLLSNTISNSGADGIDVRFGGNNDGYPGTGIFDLTINNNTVANSNSHGIVVGTWNEDAHFTLNANIQNNQITDSNDMGLDIDLDTGEDGSSMDGSLTADFVIKNNTITGNGTGVRIDSNAGKYNIGKDHIVDVALTGNTVSNNAMHGLYINTLNGTKFTGKLKDNIITGNGGNGVQLNVYGDFADSTQTVNFQGGNMVNDNLGYGVAVYAETGTTQTVDMQGDGSNTMDDNVQGDVYISIYSTGTQTITDVDGNVL